LAGQCKSGSDIEAREVVEWSAPFEGNSGIEHFSDIDDHGGVIEGVFFGDGYWKG
tara:strand:- start:741 stop:905 length:165 start_codon:yes stop_codon:yes gene_type:complete